MVDEKEPQSIDPGSLEANHPPRTSFSDEDSTLDEPEPEHDHTHNELTQVPTNASAIARTLSAVRTRESGKDLGPPPDGGFQA